MVDLTKAEKWKRDISLDRHWLPLKGFQSKGYYNVIKDCAWTPKKPPEGFEYPYIKCQEYQILNSHLMNQVNYYLDPFLDAFREAGVNVLKPAADAAGAAGNLNADAAIQAMENEDPSAAFRGLYKGEPKATYKFPYYNTYHHQINNTWQPHAGVLGGLAKFAEDIARIGLPSGGMLTIQQWTGTQPGIFPIEFILLNTVGEAFISNHQQLIDRLVMANLSSRINKVASLPPCIYSVEIPGIRYMPACVIENLQIINEGQMHSIDGKNVPEAYRLIISFKELIPEQRQIYAGAMSGAHRVEVIESDIEAAARTSANGAESSIEYYERNIR